MKPLNIMVVDDSKIIRKKLTAMFDAIGHKVVCEASTGVEAIKQYNSYKPDLVTMDITMPEMSGIEAVERIVKSNSKALIVMVTSHGQEQMVIEAIKAGAIGYLIKPFKQEKVVEQVNKVINEFLPAHL